MSERSPRQDSEIVGAMIRKDLARALDSLDILIEDTDGSVEQAERNALKDASRHVQQAIQSLNQGAAQLTDMNNSALSTMTLKSV